MSNLDLRQEIERFRERLLDLSLRNPLLSYRKSKRRTLQIVNELPDVIYERLVGDGKSFVFDFIPDRPHGGKLDRPTTHPSSQFGETLDTARTIGEASQGASDIATELPEKYPVALPRQTGDKVTLEKHFVDDKLQTNLPQEKLNTTLRYMQREAITAMQETGINYLFLAIGFLAWRESDSTKKDRLAPLILVPVHIEKISKGNGEPRFAVAWDEDDVQFNLSLQKKLFRDFDLKIPDFDEGVSPEKYFESLQGALRSKPAWEIRREALLGFFSFHKLSMYADIDPANWELESGNSANSIIERLVCGGDADETSHALNDASFYAPDYDIDNNTTVEKLILPMDADSSQQSALVDIRSGRNLVIEGPPGTGKSQTITNAIADAIAAGKTVLFVAEKLAALQVVHNRMASLGLDDFCLELHSDAASPRQVFESLRDRLSKRYHSPGELEINREFLAELRERLNTYVSEMAKAAGPNGSAVYDLLWQIIELRSGGASFCRSAVRRMPQDKQAFQNAIATLNVFAQVLAENSQPKQSVWWGFFPSGFAFRQLDEIKAILNSIVSAAVELTNALARASGDWGVTTSDANQIFGSLEIEQIRKFANATPEACAEFAALLVDEGTLIACQELANAFNTRDAYLKQIESAFVADLEILRNKQELIASLLSAVPWLHDTTLQQAETFLAWLTQLSAEVTKAMPVVQQLSNAGIPPRDITDDLARCIKLVQLIRHPIVEDSQSVTSEMFGVNANSVLRDAFHEHERLRLAQQEVAEQLDKCVSNTACNVHVACAHLQELEVSVQEVCNTLSKNLTLAEVGTLHRWAIAADSNLDRLIEICARLGQNPILRVECFEQFQKSATIVQLIRHRAVGDIACLSEAMFRSEGLHSHQRAAQSAERLAKRRAMLENTFHLPAIPPHEMIVQITKALRKNRRSWFKVLNAEYRSARSQLDEFADIKAKLKLDGWIRALQDLEQLSKDEKDFLEHSEFCTALGSGFRGVETDWPLLKTRFDWVHTARQYGLDYPTSMSLLSNKHELAAEMSNVDLRKLVASFTDMWSDSTASQCIYHLLATDPRQTDFVTLKRTVGVLIQASEKFTKLAATIGIPQDWSIREVDDFTKVLQSQKELIESKAIFAANGSFQTHLGTYFEGDQTDWKKVETVFNWVQTAKNSRADFELVSRLFAERTKQLCTFDTRQSLEYLNGIREVLNAQPEQTVAEINFETLEPDGLLGTLNAKIADIELGLAASKAVLQDEAITVSDLYDLMRLLGDFESISMQISNPANWEPLNANGLYESVTKNVSGIRKIVEWIENGKQLLQAIPSATRLTLLRDTNSAEIVEICRNVERQRSAVTQLSRSRKSLESLGKLDAGWLCIETDSLLAGKTQSEAEILLSKVEELPAWSSFCRVLDDCSRLDLDGFCDQAIDGNIPPERLIASYELSVLEIAAEKAFEESKILPRASGQVMQRLRKDFQEFDLATRELSKYEIASKASARVVPGGISKGRVGELTELALIRHESQKQRRHCRIRDLMCRSGQAVQALKPCLMMSPLSVSRFIPAGSVEFDMVIMDEASQIKPEDAIGTILRAKQLVVVGDPKQLPPTSFFDRIDEEMDDEEATQLDNTESVLEAAMKVFQPFRRLRWHYRSKHESLIRFSNSSFYDNDLVVFPSPTGDDGTYGIRHVYVEDATCTAGLNIKEAEAVVEEIVRHAITRPEESLGVGTFNKKQAEVISELLEKRCETDEAAAIAIEKLRQHDEELFIKNLENLQGDERDVIFVCYTYGRDPSSNRLMQRFGPINTEKGWRRLNVLITRSRHRMVVFSSFYPADILGGLEKSRGVNAYKDFLNYAMTGILADGGIASERSPESPFEIAVCRKIEQMGLEAVPQVGVAGFFIDIGVRHREGERSFVLGIECDGATYHSAKCARDRDRLREEIIRSRGWEIHRIWSTDWFLNQKAEEAKLEEAVRRRVEGR